MKILRIKIHIKGSLNNLKEELYDSKNKNNDSNEFKSKDIFLNEE